MATVIRHGDVRLLETPGGNHTGGLATAGRGAGEVCIYRQRQLPDGGNPPHSHDREEVLVMTVGRASVTVAGERIEIGPGDTVIVPPRTLHRVEAWGDEPAEWLIVATAGVRFFREDGEEAVPTWAG